MKRWQFISAIHAKLDRFYPLGQDNRDLTEDDIDDIEDEVTILCAEYVATLRARDH